MPPATVAVWKELYKFISKYNLTSRKSDANSFRGTLSVCVSVRERERARERHERIQDILILHILLCVHVC